ncbi:MAG: hypothetical protein LBH96_02895 [Candidatus Peribacteria bacterium]|jgi:hypothetical protein|nr:hypothetical protein [Candidatus Peribacteria bacterium]
MKHTKNKSDTDIEIFSPSEKDQILQNIFFSGKAVDGSFLYRGEEATQLYEALIHDPAYFPYQSSLNLIKKHLHQLQPYIKGKLIDYGS